MISANSVVRPTRLQDQASSPKKVGSIDFTSPHFAPKVRRSSLNPGYSTGKTPELRIEIDDTESIEITDNNQVQSKDSDREMTLDLNVKKNPYRK